MQKIKTEELRTILSNLKAGLAQGKQTTEQSDCFVFLNNRIWTYNDEICVSCPSPFEFEGAVSSKEMLLLVGKITTEEMTLEFNEGEILIKAKRTKAGLRIQQQIEMPIQEISIPKRWNTLPKNFLSSLQKCIFSAGTDFAKPILTNINCKDKVLQSCDNERATQCLLSSALKQDFLIPASSSRYLSQLNEINQYKCDSEWTHFKTKDGTIFSCRCDFEEYPVLNYFDSNGFEFSFPNQIENILDRAGIFAETEFNQDSLIEISISTKGVLKARAEGDAGWVEETIRTKRKPEKHIQFQVNPQYLQQILKQTGTAIIGENMIWFVTEEFEHVVVLED